MLLRKNKAFTRQIDVLKLEQQNLVSRLKYKEKEKERDNDYQK